MMFSDLECHLWSDRLRDSAQAVLPKGWRARVQWDRVLDDQMFCLRLEHEQEKKAFGAFVPVARIAAMPVDDLVSLVRQAIQSAGIT